MTTTLKRAATILLIEDDYSTCQTLRITLKDHAFWVLEANTGKTGLGLARKHAPDLIILDLGLPDIEGLEVIRQYREWSSQPILILSAKFQEEVIVKALELGADDYITKPFRPSELIARIKAQLRRANTALDNKGWFESGDLKVDLVRGKVYLSDQEIDFTQREFSLLRFLITNVGRVVSHRKILENVWGDDNEANFHYIRIYMSRLRRKLETDPGRPKILMTVQGVGYKLAFDPGSVNQLA